LNAEPGAFAAFPGSFGAVELRHICDGCPVPFGFEAAKALAAASPQTTAASMAVISILMKSPLRVEDVRIKRALRGGRADGFS
jgi:hypothetical protein